jgi:uncharacterized lipoprotein YajG
MNVRVLLCAVAAVLLLAGCENDKNTVKTPVPPPPTNFDAGK